MPVRSCYLAQCLQMDSTWTVGQHAIDLYVLVGVDPTATGSPVPLAAFMMNHVTGEEGARTASIKWCIEKAAELGVPTANAYFFDKDIPSFKAAAQVAAAEAYAAHAEWEGHQVALNTFAHGCTAVELEAAESYLNAVRRPDGDAGSASRVPSTYEDLVCTFPDLAAACNNSDDGSSLFAPAVPPQIRRGIARKLIGAMDDFYMKINRAVPTAAADLTFERYYEMTHGIRPFANLLLANSAMDTFLSTKCLRYAFLCNFHAWKAIEDVVRHRTTIPQAMRQAVIDGFRTVVQAPGQAELRARWIDFRSRMIDGHVSAEFLDSYLKANWLDKWEVMFAQCWRACVVVHNIGTTNHVELLWNQLKGHYLGGRKVTCYASAILALVGLPSEKGSCEQSLVGIYMRKARLVRDGIVSRAITKPAQALLRAYEVLLWRIAFGQVSCSPHSSVQGRFVYNGPRSAWHLRPDNRSPSDLRPLASVLNTRTPGAPQLRIDAIRRARQVSAYYGETPREQLKHPSLLPLSSYLTSLRGQRKTADFDALCLQRLSHAKPTGVSGLAECMSWIDPFVLDAMLALVECRDARTGPLAAYADWNQVASQLPMPHSTLLPVNAAIANCIKSGLPTLMPKDFATGTKPDVGIVYGVVIEMAAQHWLTECQRVLDDGHASNAEASITAPDWAYVATLTDARALAQAACKASQPDALIAAVYIGQELRGKDSAHTFGRIWEHGTRSGNSGIRNLFARCGDDQCVTAAGPAKVTLRMLALLPPEKDIVNIVEAICLAVLLGPGAVVLNGSPTGDPLRFFDGFNGEPSKSDVMFHNLVADRYRHASFDSDTSFTMRHVKSEWMRRAFHAVRALLQSGRHLTDTSAESARAPTSGEVSVAATLSTSSASSQGSARAGTSSLSDASDLWQLDLAWKGHQTLRGCTTESCVTDLSSSRCTCAHYSTYLCPHLIHSRLMWKTVWRYAPLWSDLNEDVVVPDGPFSSDRVTAAGLHTVQRPDRRAATSVAQSEPPLDPAAEAALATTLGRDATVAVEALAGQLKAQTEADFAAAGSVFLRRLIQGVQKLSGDVSNAFGGLTRRGGFLGRQDKAATSSAAFARTNAQYHMPVVTPAHAATAARHLSATLVPSSAAPLLERSRGLDASPALPASSTGASAASPSTDATGSIDFPRLHYGGAVRPAPTPAPRIPRAR